MGKWDGWAKRRLSNSLKKMWQNMPPEKRAKRIEASSNAIRRAYALKRNGGQHVSEVSNVPKLDYTETVTSCKYCGTILRKE